MRSGTSATYDHEPSSRASASGVTFHYEFDDEATEHATPPAATAGTATSGLLPDDGISNRRKSPGLQASATNGTTTAYELASAMGSSQGTQASMGTSSSSALLLNSQSTYSGGGSSNSQSSLHGPRKRRLPQSGLTLCGRRWLLGAEDMCLPTCWAAQFDVILTVIAAVAWRFIYTSTYPDDCGRQEKRQLEAYVALHALGYFGLLVLDVCIMFSAMRSSMFVRNRQIVWLIYVRLTLTFGVVCFTLLANIEYWHNIRPVCTYQHDGSTSLHHILATLFIASLCSFLIFGLYFICSYGFGPCCGKGTTQSWGKHLQRWLLCYTPTPQEDGRNVLESIAWIFTEFFAADRASFADEKIHVVPSDILVGLALVEAHQVRRAVEGYDFLKPAPMNRWAPDAFRPTYLERGGATEDETYRKTYGQAGKHLADRLSAQLGPHGGGADGAGRGGDDDSKELHVPNTFSVGIAPSIPTPNTGTATAVGTGGGTATAIATQPTPGRSPSPSPDPLQAAQQGLADQDQAAKRLDAVLPHERPDYALSLAVSSGTQPELDPRDWQKIADARHFSPYAIGSYGWLMYAFNNATCCLTCRACRCCTKHGYNRANMIGSGIGVGLCGTEGCCHWSIAAFLLTTGVQDKDILYAHLSDSPVYYLTIDHHQKCVVICCRGTLSVADAVIDLDASLAPLDEYGYPGGYTHTGILENALRLKKDLERRGLMEDFLRSHPTYNIAIVGHSLGAATAALLTLLLRDQYDSGPPAVTTASRLTGATRNRLTCIAYGPPLLLDLSVAQSEFALRCITTIVHHSDIISRLSLASCALLKDQMISCFSVSSSSKFRILSNSLRQNYLESFEPNSNLREIARAAGNESNATPNLQAYSADERTILSNPSTSNVNTTTMSGVAATTTQRPHRKPRTDAVAHARLQHALNEAADGSEDDDEEDDGADASAPTGSLPSPDGVGGSSAMGAVAKAMGSLNVLPEEADARIRAETAARKLTREKGQEQALRAFERRRSSVDRDGSALAAATANEDGPSPIPLLQAIGGGAATPEKQPLTSGYTPQQMSPPLRAHFADENGAHQRTQPIVSHIAIAGEAPSASASSSTSAPASTSAQQHPFQRGHTTASGLSSNPHGSFTLHLRKCYLPGRIYHVLPGVRDAGKYPRWGGFARSHRSQVVYPSAQETFQEIVVNKSMFSESDRHIGERTFEGRPQDSLRTIH